jgi:hypothetical protein
VSTECRGVEGQPEDASESVGPMLSSTHAEAHNVDSSKLLPRISPSQPPSSLLHPSYLSVCGPRHSTRGRSVHNRAGDWRPCISASLRARPPAHITRRQTVHGRLELLTKRSCLSHGRLPCSIARMHVS